MDPRLRDRLILDGTKIGLYQERVQDWRAGKRVAPITVDMALTRACNLNCVYCYGKLQENDGKVITDKVIDRTFRDFAEIGVRGVSLVSDGESTCSPYLVHACRAGARNGLAMALGTNGVALTQSKIRDIMPTLSYLRFNISAGEKKRYDEIMRPADRTAYNKVIGNVLEAVKVRREKGLETTIGLQMVLMPEFGDQVLPLAKLALDLEVDYLVIKHCSDDENGSLGVDYAKYREMEGELKIAEGLSTPNTAIVVKWSKIREGNVRTYEQCYGPPFLLQISGSGLVAPCGMLFGEKYQAYHIGNIVDTGFKEIWQSERYWKVMRELSSERFDARRMCGCLCLQHSVNKALDHTVRTGELPEWYGEQPKHKEFV